MPNKLQKLTRIDWQIYTGCPDDGHTRIIRKFKIADGVVDVVGDTGIDGPPQIGLHYQDDIKGGSGWYKNLPKKTTPAQLHQIMADLEPGFDPAKARGWRRF